MAILMFLLYLVPILCILVTIYVLIEAVKYFRSLNTADSSSSVEQTKY